MSSIVLTADTLLGTPTVGGVEYDGYAFYGTPQGTQRGAMPAAQYYRLNSGYVGANVNTAQSVFGVGVTLSTNTVYAFEGVYMLTKTAGTTTHSVGTGFGGTATLNNIGYNALGAIGGTNPINELEFGSLIATSATATAVTTGTSGATLFATILLRGTVSVNGGGTFIPQYILSAAPGGGYTTVAGSYFMIYPISNGGANTSIGAWA
jgi:hypothetical protein